MSDEYTDDRESAVTQAEFDAACGLELAVKDFEQEILKRAERIDEANGIAHSVDQWKDFRAIINDALGDYYSDALLEAREVMDNFDDGYISQNRLRKNQLL
jgi:hypothetical protein